MIKKVVVCDMCGREIKGKATKVTMMTAFGQKESEQVEGYEGSICAMDYCMECTGKVVEFLNSHIKKEEETSSGEEKTPETVVKEESKEKTLAPKENGSTTGKEKTKTKRKTLDKGKIMALKKAGWSNEKIADEMGTTKSSIASTVYMEKKKMQESKE